MDENEMQQASMLAQLDQAIAISTHLLNENVALVRDTLKEQDVATTWMKTGNAMIVNFDKNNITMKALIGLLATAIIQLAQIKEEENDNV